MKKRAIIGRIEGLEGRLKGLGTGTLRDLIVSFQTDANNLHSQVSQKLSQISNLDAALNEARAKLDNVDLDDMASKLMWLHERVDLMATRLENMRGDITLDAAAAQRLTFAVGQFAARLDRLEQPRRKRRPNGTAHAARK
jgi:hypothetical protein